MGCIFNRGRRKVNDRGFQTSGHRNRQTYETLLVYLWRSLGQRTGSGGLNVEPGETEAAADDKHERNKPRELTGVAPVLQGRSISPGIGQNRRSQTKRNDVRERIELDSDLGRALSHPRDATIQTVTDKRPANSYSRIVKSLPRC